MTIPYLDRNLFLFLAREVDEMVILRADQKGDSSLVESSALAIPFLDRVQGTLPGEIKHEQNGNCIVADKRKHVDKFPLPTKVPDRESDFCIPD